MRRVRLVLVIVVALIGLGGCWGTKVDTLGPNNYYVTVTEQKSTETIFYCVSHFPDSTLQQAECAMDVIRVACANQSIGWGQCNTFTDHSAGAETCVATNGAATPCSKSMKKAIAEVIGSRECLTFEHSPEGIGPSHMWIATDDNPGNALSCG